jgi:hypothetical protein
MQGERGAALPLAIMALALGSLVVTPFLGHASSNLIGSGVYAQGLAERYAADAGIEYAIWGLMSETLVVEEGGAVGLPPFTLNDKAVTASVYNQGSDTYLVTATATSDDGHSTTIESLLKAGGGAEYHDGDIYLGWQETHSGDALADGNIFLDSQASITGSAYATGDITMGWDTQITGDAVAGDDLSLNSLATIAGSASAAGDIVLYWRAEINGDTCAGGDLSLYSEASLGGDAVTAGNAYLSWSAQAGGDLYITASNKNLFLDSQARIWQNVYVSGDINNVYLGYQARIQGGLYITGTITGTLTLGWQASIAGGIHENYSGSFPPLPACPSLPTGGDDIIIISWE